MGDIIESPFWATSTYPPEHLSYFNKNGLKNLMAEYGWKIEIITRSYPIDFHLFNEYTNYVQKKNVGKNCHEASLEIEELMRDVMGVSGLVDIYRKLGEPD